MLLFCPKCGKKMTEDMVSCGYCGASRVNEASVPPLFIDKGGRASAPDRKEAAPAVQSSRSMFGSKKAGDDSAGAAPGKEKKSLSSMFGKKGGDQPVADKPAGKGKHDLSSMFKRKPKHEPAASGRRSVLEDAAPVAMAGAAATDDANPFRPMAVGAAGSSDFSLMGAVEYSGFWRRFFAVFIDSLISGVGIVALMFVVGLLGFGMGSFENMGEDGMPLVAIVLQLMNILLPWVYYAGFEASGMQATPGKRLLGIRVCDTDGQRISFLRATGRYWGKLLSAIPLAIGYLMQPFTERKQALHDKLASTLVIRDRS